MNTQSGATPTGDPWSLWKSAQDLAGLGSATRAWLTGAAVTNPTYLGAPEAETSEIRGYLADLNGDGGFVTFSSQPARHGSGDGSAQRAYVCGWTNQHVADPLARELSGTDLLVLTPNADSRGAPIPVTLLHGEPVTFVGHWLPDHELDPYREVLHPRAMQELADAQQVVVIDPVWGRSEYLWQQLPAALDRLTTCAPSLAHRVHELCLDVVADIRGFRNPDPTENPELWLRWQTEATRCSTALLFEGALHRVGWHTVVGLSDLTAEVQARVDAEGLPVHLEGYASYATVITQTRSWVSESSSAPVNATDSDGAKERAHS